MRKATSILSHFSGQIRSVFRSHHNHHFKQPRRFMTTQQPKGNWKQNGTPEIIIGTTIFVLVGVDNYLQKQQEASRQEIMLNLKTAIRHDETKEKQKEEDQVSIPPHKVKIFDCIVRRIPKYFDGNKSLMGVNVGDRVSILQESVGPDGMYHLCRLEKGKNRRKDGDDAPVGWFPISCLEKLA